MAALAGAALPVVIVNPAQVRHFAQAVGKRAKTDPIDAAVIARFAEAVKPEIRPLPDEKARLLGELVARRRQIVGMTVAERQREQRTAIARVRKSILRHSKMLEKELAEIDTRSAPWCVVRPPGATRKTCWLPLSGDRPIPGAHPPCRNAGTWTLDAARDRTPSPA